jgi:ABC-2 type transport system permease protein
MNSTKARNAVKAEWIKLISVRSTQVSYALVMLLTVAFAALVAAAGTDPTNAEALSGLVGLGLLPGPGLVLLFVVAALSVTGEWRSGTFRTTFLAAPDRAWAGTAKALVVAGVGALVSLLSAGAGLLVAGALARPTATGLGFAGDLRVLWSVPIAVFFGGFFAIGVGNVIRHSAGAITLLVVWMLVLESLLIGVFFLASGGAAQIPKAVLPFQGLEQFVSGPDPQHPHALSPTLSLLVFAAWSRGRVGAGVVATLRRDP